ncbi:MAG: PQQ-dependent sugar dehydrogenase [Pseudomonadota bacterium]
MYRLMMVAAGAALIAACTGEASAPEPDADGAWVSDSGLKLVPLAEGLEFPWDMVELPNGNLLVTEREGRLRLITETGLTDAPIAGLPDDILVDGQGGLMGLTLAPDFAESRMLYISYAKDMGDTNTTAVISAMLSDDASVLEEVTEIFTAAERETTFHFGGRIAVLPDGTLAIGLGDGYRYMDEAQDPSNLHGAIARINSDGSVPEDNPFADDTGHPLLWSYGHRNVQGLQYDAARGILWAHEHGPKGGDELNVIEQGANFGWPTITYGINYDGTIITEETEAAGMEQPVTKWVPSIAPSGLALVTTEAFADWSGDLLIGAMNGPKGMKLVRVDIDDEGGILGEEDLLADVPLGYRDVLSTPSGVYLATNGLDGAVYKVEPNL